MEGSLPSLPRSVRKRCSLLPALTIENSVVDGLSEQTNFLFRCSFAYMWLILQVADLVYNDIKREIDQDRLSHITDTARRLLRNQHCDGWSK